MAVARLVSGKNFHRMAAETPERWESLAKVGFKADPYGDIQRAINVKLGGFYIDVGAGKLISDGQIKMKSDAVPVSYSDTGLEFSDGSNMPADIIVLATGFLGNLKEHVARILGADVAELAGDCFGVDEEGELHGVFKPTGRKSLLHAIVLEPQLITPPLQTQDFGILVAAWVIQGTIRASSRYRSRPISWAHHFPCTLNTSTHCEVLRVYLGEMETSCLL